MQTVLGATGFRHPTARAVPLKRARFWLVCLFFILWVAVITGRLFWLQVVEHADFVDRAAKQQLHTFEVAPRRGMLYDRNLRELAMTVQVDSIYADPNEIADKAGAAKALAAVVHTDADDAQTSEEQIAARLGKGNSFAWIARRVTPEVAAAVKALPIKGIYFEKEFQRFYPNNDLAAQTLGFVGADDTGLGGLEKKFEPELHGTPGQKYTAMDARRRVLGSNEDHPAGAGQNLVLTIDENIQFMAERALDHAMAKTHAQNGTVVVQDVHTGEILALAIRPAFNPNMARRTDKELLKNHAVSDAYEPGSVFKLMTYSAALEEKVAKPDDPIDCLGGQITLAGRVIHDDVGEHYHVIPVHEALEHSSDVAAVKLALKIGPDKFYDYMRSFGFGSKSGVELPGETRGLLRPVKGIGKVPGWSGSSIGSLAIGQEVAVTPLQMVSMVSTIANGGVYLPPHVLMVGQFESGPDGLKAIGGGRKAAGGPEAMPFKLDEALPNPLPQGAHRVISEMTAAEMRKMMEGVVLYGTGKEAQLNGYSSGGKTGTAQKVDPQTHLYSKTMHIASFAGIAPVNNPEIAVAVIMDSPQGEQHGAIVSAPVFSEVAQEVLEYLGVPHDIEKRAARPGDKKPERVNEDDGVQNEGDINALYAAVNDLPSDDPLRGDGGGSTPAGARLSNPAPVSDEKTATGNAGAAVAKTMAAGTAQPQPQPQHATNGQADGGGHLVSVLEAAQIRVPSLVGLPIRKVIEQAAAAGLEVNIHGNGTAREQAPAAGTMVAAGTQVVVRAGQ